TSPALSVLDSGGKHPGDSLPAGPRIGLVTGDGLWGRGAVTVPGSVSHGLSPPACRAHKVGDPDARCSMDPAGDVAEFPIRSVSWRDAGSYSCQYSTKSDLSIWSEPSDTVELMVAESSYTKLNISLHPSGRVTPGGAVTVRCECRCRGARVLLSKAGDSDAQRSMDAAGDMAEFPIRSVSWRDAGNYSCRYSTRLDPPVWSEPSDPVELVIAGHEFLKPTISVSPSRVVALGGSVTIHCEGRQRSMEFFLRKAGRPNRQVRTVPDGTVAEFPIASVGQEDGGSYTCDYRSIADHNRWSYPSDPVNMIIWGRGRGDPCPQRDISLSPSGGVSLGGAVTVRCWGQHQGVQFVLNKERRHFPPADLDGSEAVFSSSNVHQDLGGSYSCSYHSRSEPFAVSYPSDPVELVVRGEGPASASPFPAPPPSQTLTGAWSQWDAQSQALHWGGSPARGEQQPLETRGREATLMLPLVCRNRESLFNPVIPSPLFARPRPRQCPGRG
uniref:Ig-like domain-containing protein n=1 Tax=Terrapene triunguis TaxID=2587831 RepID=A0A674IC50_9SAUR